MLGSDFLETFKGKGLAAWEAAAFDLAQHGSTVSWPMVDVQLSVDGHQATLHVASDVFAVGTPEDFLRLPLTPGIAQSIANLNGFLLPTPKMAYEIWKAAEKQGVQLTPSLQWPNRGASLEDYAKHDVAVQAQLKVSGKSGLVSGHKKDVIVSNIAKAGKVLIYGWFWPAGTKPPAGLSQPIQARSNIHYDGYVDYSHGIRFIAPVMTVDGQEHRVEDVLRDPVLSKLISDEGPLRMMRYPAKNDPAPYRPVGKTEYQVLNDVFPKANTTSLADQGLAALVAARLGKQ